MFQRALRLHRREVVAVEREVWNSEHRLNCSLVYWTNRKSGLVLWNINHCWLFNAKFCFYIYIIYKVIFVDTFLNEPKLILFYTGNHFKYSYIKVTM